MIEPYFENPLSWSNNKRRLKGLKPLRGAANKVRKDYMSTPFFKFYSDGIWLKWDHELEKEIKKLNLDCSESFNYLLKCKRS